MICENSDFAICVTCERYRHSEIKFELQIFMENVINFEILQSF